MNTLIIADITKDNKQKILNVLDSIEGDKSFLVGDFGHFKIESGKVEELGLENVQCVSYPLKRISVFDRKILIKSINEEFNKNARNLLKHFKIATGDYRPFIWRKEVSTHDTLDNVNVIIKAAKKPDIARYILKFDVFNPNMRFLNAKKMKFYINRAFFRTDFMARKKKVFLSDKFKVKQYQYGIEYCVGQLTERPSKSPEEMVEAFNEHLVQFGIRALRLEIYSMDVKAADISDFFMSEIQTDYPIDQVKSAISGFLDSSEYTVKVKVPGMMRDSYVTVEIDARPLVKDIWTEQINGLSIIRMISAPPVNFYVLLPSLLKTSQKNIMRFPAKRLEYFKQEEEGALDFFDETCEECGETIQKNPFDEQIDEHFCARHLPFDKDIQSVIGTAETDEDKEADLEAEKIEATSGISMSTDNDVADIEGEGDTFEQNEDQD